MWYVNLYGWKHNTYVSVQLPDSFFFSCKPAAGIMIKVANTTIHYFVLYKKITSMWPIWRDLFSPWIFSYNLSRKILNFCINFVKKQKNKTWKILGVQIFLSHLELCFLLCCCFLGVSVFIQTSKSLCSVKQVLGMLKRCTMRITSK